MDATTTTTTTTERERERERAMGDDDGKRADGIGGVDAHPATTTMTTKKDGTGAVGADDGADADGADGARALVDAMENGEANDDGDDDDVVDDDGMAVDEAPMAKRARGGNGEGEDPASGTRGGRGAGTSEGEDAMDEDGGDDADDVRDGDDKIDAVDDDDDADVPAEQRGLEDYDDQLTLPRRTKVLISGNNRTKGKLVGLKGIVKKAVGLGGWHWLVLSNGQEVRLQRNALTVLEHPSGDEPESDGGDEEDVENGEEEGDEEDGEDDDDDDDDDDDGDEKDAMKTRLRRPTRVPGNGPPSQAAAAAMKRLQERRRSARPNCQSNFERLTTTTLLKYKKAYGLEANEETDKNKRALIQEVGKHFISQKVDEQKVLQQFMCSVADTTQLK